MADGILIRDCATCGKPFTVPRRRGRPPVTCSEACREQRGRRGDVRLSAGSRGTAFAYRDDSGVRHNGASAGAGVIADAFGADAEAGIPGAYLDMGWVKDQLRKTGRKDPLVRRGLEPALDPGCTCLRVGRVIGQADLPWNWAERLDQGERLADMKPWDGLVLAA